MFSTSSNINVALSFIGKTGNTLFKISVELNNIKKGIIHPNFGTCAFFMENFTECIGEKEILFPSGSYFKILDVY